MFKGHIGWSIEVYVDDLLVKSKTPDQHIADLYEAFVVLRQYRMKLNPAKCLFGVESRNFLCYMASEQGIEDN